MLDMPLLDTRCNDGNDLDRRFVADLVLQILSYVADKERANTLARQRQGIDVMPVDPQTGKKISKKTGRPTGRPAAKYPDGWEDVYTRWQNGDLTAVAAMRQLNLTRSTFYKLAAQYK